MTFYPLCILGTEESTREFIQLRYKLRHLFNGKKHECAKAYKRIVEELGLSESVTAVQARKKWSNLVQKYKMLDTIVPLMRKESIALGVSCIDKVESVLQSDLSLKTDSDNQPVDSRSFSNVITVEGIQKCDGETVDAEPPQKKQKRRKAARKARERWWGAVEDEDLGSDSGGSASRGDILVNYNVQKASSVKDLDPSEMEIQTFQMLKSCADSLTEIKEILKSQSQTHQEMLEKLVQTASQQGETLKNLLFTFSSQNSAIVTLSSRLSGDGVQPNSGLPANRSFDQKDRSQPQSHSNQDNQLLTSQQTLINALSHQSQHCNSSLVDNSELI
ncbi:uncharacterized protein LOC135212468 isoform X3 [Macrobrachium nipponense]|uniref:uncharacterized protein LOC135212468 isoform X3 n=1 Tax=Macrobrachium nipponense TaxID=159736 RepID=UPI0030C7DE33